MNIDTDNISCIILAGGQGKRFNNRDKGLIELDGISFIERAINCMKPQVDDIIISANRNLEVYEQYSPTVVTDDAGDYRGPLSGISAALPHCRHEWVIVIPCDMPYLPDDLVAQLSSSLVGEKIAVVESNRRLQLVLLMHHSLLASIRQCLDLGHYKIMQWLQSHKHVVVEFPGKHHIFDNINSDRDLSKLS